jgi:hypothetical protein
VAATPARIGSSTNATNARRNTASLAHPSPGRRYVERLPSHGTPVRRTWPVSQRETPPQNCLLPLSHPGTATWSRERAGRPINASGGRLVPMLTRVQTVSSARALQD